MGCNQYACTRYTVHPTRSPCSRLLTLRGGSCQCVFLSLGILCRSASEMVVIKYPKPSQPAHFGASRRIIFQTRVRIMFNRLLNAIRLPGAIRDLDHIDPVSGQEVQIKVGVLFTRISINGRDYYFRRLSGRFDGTGSGCR